MQENERVERAAETDIQEVARPRAWFCGFRLGTEAPARVIYTLQHEVKPYWPVISGGRIVFFRKPESAREALALDDDPVVHGCQVTSISQGQLFDVPTALGVVANAERDDSGSLIDLVNTLDDFLIAAGISLPDAHKRPLYDFADHLTFEREFASFIDPLPHGREVIRDGILWMVDAVLARSVLVGN